MMDRDALLQMMGKIWNAYGLRLEQSFREAGLPMNAEQYRFLKVVHERPGQYQEIYARLLGRDRSSTRRLRAAEFALLSYGPDKRADLSRRVSFSGPKDSGGVGRENVNEDNMVETGP